jgi:broad specificity phosphatase PhoE
MNKELVDAPLHKYGILQATIASELVNKINIGVIFCSPLRRTLQTTQILFRNYF